METGDSLPWPFTLLCTSISIIRSSPSQFMWSVITKIWRWWQRFTSLVCLSSLVSLSFTSVMFFSSSKPLFPHFIDPSTLTVHTRDVWNVHKTWIAQQSYFIVLTVCRCDVTNHDRLGNGFSIISYHFHRPYTQHMKPWQTIIASVGLPQLICL